METLKQKVETILKDYPPTRDDDMLLIGMVWRTFYKQFLIENDEGIPFVRLKHVIEDLPNTESIRRTRQKLQGEGKYRGTNYLARKEKADKVRETINTSEWDTEINKKADLKNWG